MKRFILYLLSLLLNISYTFSQSTILTNQDILGIFDKEARLRCEKLVTEVENQKKWQVLLLDYSEKTTPQSKIGAKEIIKAKPTLVIVSVSPDKSELLFGEDIKSKIHPYKKLTIETEMSKFASFSQFEKAFEFALKGLLTIDESFTGYCGIEDKDIVPFLKEREFFKLEKFIKIEEKLGNKSSNTIDTSSSQRNASEIIDYAQRTILIDGKGINLEDILTPTIPILISAGYKPIIRILNNQNLCDEKFKESESEMLADAPNLGLLIYLRKGSTATSPDELWIKASGDFTMFDFNQFLGLSNLPKLKSVTQFIDDYNIIDKSIGKVYNNVENFGCGTGENLDWCEFSGEHPNIIVSNKFSNNFNKVFEIAANTTIFKEIESNLDNYKANIFLCPIECKDKYNDPIIDKEGHLTGGTLGSTSSNFTKFSAFYLTSKEQGQTSVWKMYKECYTEVDKLFKENKGYSVTVIGLSKEVNTPTDEFLQFQKQYEKGQGTDNTYLQNYYLDASHTIIHELEAHAYREIKGIEESEEKDHFFYQNIKDGPSPTDKEILTNDFFKDTPARKNLLELKKIICKKYERNKNKCK